MKKIIILLFLGIGIFLAVNKNSSSWIKENFVSKPTPYYRLRFEFFENISLKYYGVKDYAEELEAVNRTVQLTETNSDRTELLIPSLEAIRRLKQRQTVLSLEDNSIMRENHSSLSGHSDTTNINNLSDKTDLLKSSTLALLFTILIISATISIIGYLLYRRKVRRSSWLWLPDDNEPIITDDRILLDFDITTDEDRMKEQNRTQLHEINL